VVEELLTGLSYKDRFLDQLRTLTNFFKHQQLRDRFCFLCLSGHFQRHRALFDNFPATFIEWRWGSLLTCLRHLSTLHPALAIGWDSRYMRGDVIARDEPEPQPQPDRGGDFAADDQPDLVGDVIDDEVFWVYLHMLVSLGDAVDGVLDWLQRCPCHPSKAALRVGRLSSEDVSSSSSSLVCPLRGRFTNIISPIEFSVSFREWGVS
jgi:hypothetical protein